MAVFRPAAAAAGVVQFEPPLVQAPAPRRQRAAGDEAGRRLARREPAPSRRRRGTGDAAWRKASSAT